MFPPFSIQSDRRNTRVWAKVRVLLRTVSKYRVSFVQMSIDGFIADTRVRLASVCGATNKGGILWWRFHICLMQIQSVNIVSTRYTRPTNAIVKIVKLYCACVAFKYCLLKKIKVWKNKWLSLCTYEYIYK